jgi:hypothetical protein
MTQAEYDSRTKNEQEELTEVLSDFYYYYNKILPYLKKNNISSFYTTKAIIKIQQQDEKNTEYIKKKLNHVVGLIMVNSTSTPKIFLGVDTDIGLSLIISKYFKIKHEY